MGNHLKDGEFQSDKYPTTPPGCVPLKVTDVTAQDLLWEYAQRRRKVDAEFADDLEQALRGAGFARDPSNVPLFFFGCWDESGHYWRCNDGAQKIEYGGPDGWPFKYQIDAGFCRPGDQEQGKVWLWHSEGWTILSSWDRSVDKRGNCNANFAAPELLTGEQIMAMARNRYPEFFARIGYAFEIEGRAHVGVPEERKGIF